MTENKVVLDVYEILPDDDVCALIVRFHTGIFYTSQSGGINCTYPEVEGFLWKFITGSFPDSCSYFCGHTFENISQKQLNAFIQEFNNLPDIYTFRLEVDISFIDDLQEGWIPVKIHMEDGKVDYGILATGNCN